MADMGRWIKQAKAEDAKLSKLSTDKLKGDGSSRRNDEKEKRKSLKNPSAHLYDKGYKKWDNLDTDSESESVVPVADEEDQVGAIPVRGCNQSIASRRNGKEKSVEELKKEGNVLFGKKKYSAALNRYKRAKKLDLGNYLVLSNIALTYLKMKRFTKVEKYCNLVLKAIKSLTTDNSSVVMKILLRRGTARLSLGYLSAAQADFLLVTKLEQQNGKSVKQMTEASRWLRKARQMIKTSRKHLPRQTIPIQIL